MTYVPARGKGLAAYHISCPVLGHTSKLNCKTGCTRRRSFTRATETEVLNKLKLWALKGMDVLNRLVHMAMDDEIPTDEQIATPPPTPTVPTLTQKAKGRKKAKSG